MNPPSRREFIRTAALAVSGAAVGLGAAAQAGGRPSRQILGFSKPFQSLGPEESADFVAKVGWDGIEIPVRKGGQIETDRAEDELPRFVDVFRQRGLDIPIVVTDIAPESAHDPKTRTLLHTIAKLGIKRVRLGLWKYTSKDPIPAQLERFGAALLAIGGICGELGIRAGVENHSGADYFGAPVWDVVTALREHRVRNVGIFFDIGHATIEGGLSWPIQARLAEPYYVGVYVKDFFWMTKDGRWRPEWCPLGQGALADGDFIRKLAASDYDGPIVQHQEYPLGGPDEMLGHMRRDLRVLRDWLAT